MNRCQKCQNPTAADELTWWEHPPIEPWWLMDDDHDQQGISVCPDCDSQFVELAREQEDQ